MQDVNGVKQSGWVRWTANIDELMRAVAAGAYEHASEARASMGQRRMEEVTERVG